MATLFVDKLDPQSGTALEIGSSGDTVTVPSGATFNVAGTVGTGFTPGITEADMWRLTTAFSGSVQPISSNWERCDEDTFAKIGTGMSVSSGIWSFPVTGLYHVIWNCSWQVGSAVSRYVYSELITTNDNASYTERGVGWTSIFNGSGDTYTSSICSAFVNVSNVSNQKVKLGVNVANSSVDTRGSSTSNQTWVTFIRLGDSQ